MSLGQRIRQLRQANGLTQSQLGGPELSKSFISLLEKDRTQPSVDTLLLIARRLGTSVDALLGQSGNIPELACVSLLSLSREAIERRQYDEANRYLDLVVFLSAQHSLKEASCEILLQQGQIELDRRAFGAAWEKLDAAYHASEERGDQWRTGRALLMMGLAKLRQREFPAAASLLGNALSALRRAKAGRDPARVKALLALGTTLIQMGDYTAASRRYREAARSDIAQQDLKLRGQALWGIGLAERKLGNLDAAKEFLLKAKDAFEHAEELRDLMRILHNLGQLFHEQGRSREALRHLHHALRVADRMNTVADRASTYTEIARVNVSLGNIEDGEHFAEMALQEAININDAMEIAEAKTVLAEIKVRRNYVSDAIELMKDAISIFRERKMREKMAVVAREIGLLLRAQGEHAQAAEYLALSLEHTQSVKGAPRATAEISE